MDEHRRQDSYYDSQSQHYQSYREEEEEEDESSEDEEEAAPNEGHEEEEEEAVDTSRTRGRKRAKPAPTAPFQRNSKVDPLLIGPVAGGPQNPEILLSFSAHTAFFVYQGIVSDSLVHTIFNDLSYYLLS